MDQNSQGYERLLQNFVRWAHGEEDIRWRALAATMDLFRWVTLETAQKLDYALPTDRIEYATELVHRLSTQLKG